jgi:hypothetical protein
MQKFLTIFLALFLAFLAVAIYLILRFQVLGALIVAAVVAGLIYVAYLLVGKSVKRLFMAPFVAKGMVLRKAKAQVHSIREARRQNVKDVRRARLEAEAEEGEDVDDEDILPPNLRYFTIDVTIRPTFPAKRFTLWEPAELLLVPFHADDNKLDEDTDKQGYVEHCEIYEDGKFVDREVHKLEGRRRIRLLFSVPEGLRRVKFRYYFESFGKVELPEPGEEEAEGAPQQNGSSAKPLKTEEAPPRRKKNKVKNTQRLNLSMLSEEARSEAGNSDDVSAPPWSAGKQESGSGPRDIAMPPPNDGDDEDENEPLVDPRDVKVTSRINIPPAPKFDSPPAGGDPAAAEGAGASDGGTAAAEPEASPDQTGAQPPKRGAEIPAAPAGAPDDGQSAAPQEPEPAEPRAQATAEQPQQPQKTQAVHEDFSAGSQRSQPGSEEEKTTADGQKIVKPIKIDPMPISAKSTAVKQSTLTQRLMELSRKKDEPGEKGDDAGNQPWQKPKHPERLREPEPEQEASAPERQTAAQENANPPADDETQEPESAAGRKFYVAREGRPTGPYSLADIRQMLEQGDLEDSQHAWTEGLPYWVTVSSILYNYR